MFKTQGNWMNLYLEKREPNWEPFLVLNETTLLTIFTTKQTILSLPIPVDSKKRGGELKTDKKQSAQTAIHCNIKHSCVTH